MIVYILCGFIIHSRHEGDPSICIHWDILTFQVSLVALGSKLKEGRGNFVFQHRAETADGCTSEVFASTHKLGKKCMLYADALAYDCTLSSSQTKGLKNNLWSFVIKKIQYLFNSILHFFLSFNATRHYCQVTSETNPFIGFCGFEH